MNRIIKYLAATLLIITVSIIMLSISDNASATDRYLDDNNIQLAIDSCADGDTLYVSNITHTAAVDINWNKRINVIGNGTSAVLSIGGKENRMTMNMNITNLNFSTTNKATIRVLASSITLNFYNCRLYASGDVNIGIVQSEAFSSTILLENTSIVGAGKDVSGIRCTSSMVTLVNSTILLTHTAPISGIRSTTSTVNLYSSSIHLSNDLTPIGMLVQTTSIVTAHNTSVQTISCIASTIYLHQCDDGAGGEPATTITSGTIYSYERIEVSTPVASHLIQARYSSTLIASYLTNSTGVATMYSIPSTIKTSGSSVVQISTFNTTVFSGGAGTVECWDLNITAKILLTDTDGNLTWVGTNHYFDLALNNRVPMLSSPTCLPVNGTNTTEFVFVVTAQDSDVYDNISVILSIDDTPYVMSKDGVLFTYYRTFTLGLHSYNYTATDGELSVTSINYTLFVDPPFNYPPVLSGNYITHVGLNYTFFVAVFDFEDDPLTVVLFLNGTPNSMTSIGGSLYIFNTLLEEGSINYSFNATGGFKWAIPINGTIVAVNTPPVLSNPLVIPTTGDDETLFTFMVHAYDIDEQELSVLLKIDNSSYPMTKHGDIVYIKSLTLSPGTYNFSFNATAGFDYATELIGTVSVAVSPGISITLMCGDYTPFQGDTNTLFTFTVEAYSPEAFSVFIEINDVNHTMVHDVGPIYSYSTILPIGLNTFTFWANNSGESTSLPGGSISVEGGFQEEFNIVGLNSFTYPGTTSVNSSDLLAQGDHIWIAIWAGDEFQYDFADRPNDSFNISYGQGFYIFSATNTTLFLPVFDESVSIVLDEGLHFVGNPTPIDMTAYQIYTAHPNAVWIATYQEGEFNYFFTDNPDVNADMVVSSRDQFWIFIQ